MNRGCNRLLIRIGISNRRSGNDKLCPDRKSWIFNGGDTEEEKATLQDWMWGIY